MANRRLTVLNPNGYQEILQTADTLLVDSPSSFAGSSFSSNVTFTTADFSGNVTIGGTPSQSDHAATKAYVDASSASVALTASNPITINSQVIDINYATDSTDGSVRFATSAEIAARTAVDAAVKPNQLAAILDDIVIDGNAPIVVTESSTNNWDISINYATVSFAGAVRFASDPEATAGTSEVRAVNPKQLKAAIDAIPYATASSNGLVQFATGAEVTAGTSNTVAVTPAQLSQEVGTVDVTTNAPLTVTETNRVFDLDINYATTTADGTVRFASSAEMSAGTSGTVVVSPLDLENRLADFEISDGSTTVEGLVRFATNSEALAGTEALAAVSPASLRYALDQATYVLDGGTY